MNFNTLLARQREYFESGATRLLSFRMEALRRLQKALQGNEDLINKAMKADLNKSPLEAYMTETGMVLAEIRFHLKHLPRWARTKNVRTPMTQFHAKSFVVPEPYGVVLVMSPWNYPLQLCLVSLTGAISAGNCVVVKPSAYAPATSGAIAEIICGIFPPEYIAVVDGHDGMGMVVGHKAMTMAVEKAKKYGMGMVAARNSTHYGIAGYFASMAVKENMIGITGTNARPSIAPTFGVENMLGTNPLTFGIPTDEEFPFVLDCATSITQRGKIEYFAREGKDTPAGMVIGHDGKPMTDSAAILDALVKETAALAPLGGMGEELAGYKGYGYATVVEILSAALQAGSYMKNAYRARRSRGKGALSSGAFLYRHRYGSLCRSGELQKNRRGYFKSAARFRPCSGREPDLYRRREGIPGLAGKKGQGRSRGGSRAEGIHRGARSARPAAPVPFRIIIKLIIMD